MLGLQWGSPVFLPQGKSFSNLPPQITFSTNALLQVWGAVLVLHDLSGTWSRAESQLHLDPLELKAVFLTLQGFRGDVNLPVSVGSIEQFHSGGTHHLPGRNVLP